MLSLNLQLKGATIFVLLQRSHWRNRWRQPVPLEEVYFQRVGCRYVHRSSAALEASRCSHRRRRKDEASALFQQRPCIGAASISGRFRRSDRALRIPPDPRGQRSSRRCSSYYTPTGCSFTKSQEWFRWPPQGSVRRHETRQSLHTTFGLCSMVAAMNASRASSADILRSNASRQQSFAFK